jgi:hypothetical protein
VVAVPVAVPVAQVAVAQVAVAQVAVAQVAVLVAPAVRLVVLES